MEQPVAVRGVGAMADRILAECLRFPEGPIAMPDGSVVLVEIERGTLSRVSPDGVVSVVATTGGGPNGAALGPDGKVYVCNNGGFAWAETALGLHAIGTPADYTGGSIDRVDLVTGKVERLYERAGEFGLRGPNDIVFDRQGGFWFSDLGKFTQHGREFGALYYGRPDGAPLVRAAAPMMSPNGVGLSPDESILYVAETATARIWAFDLAGPGTIRPADRRAPHGGRLLYASQTYRGLDSLAVEACGNICVASIIDGGIVVVSPEGRQQEVVPFDDPLTTNICFGGSDLRTAFITLSSTGRLAVRRWPRPGLPLNFLNSPNAAPEGRSQHPRF